MSPPEQMNFNPYASPRAETVAEEDLPATGPFGLEEPIRAAGAMTPKEVRDTLRPAMGPRLGPWIWIGPAGAGFLMLAWPSSSLCWASVLAFFVSMVAVVHISRVFITRSHVRLLAGSRQEMLFSEDHVFLSSATGRAVLSWHEFRWRICSDSAILLALSESDFVCVPRFFLSSDRDWQLLVALVEHKVATKQPKSPRKVGLSSPMPEPPPELWETLQASAESVRGRGRLTETDVRTACRCFSGRWFLRALPAVSIGIVLLPISASFLLWSHKPDPASLVVTSLAVAFSVWVYVLAPRRHLRRQSRDEQEAYPPWSVLASEEGLLVESSPRKWIGFWSQFDRFRQLPDLLLLHFKSSWKVQMLARSFFTDSDWDRLIALITRKLPRI